MSRLYCLLLLITISGLRNYAIGQTNLTTVTLSTNKCAHISSNMNSNLNWSRFDVGTYYVRGRQFHRRAFIEFDIASQNIPSNAIIHSATLKIRHTGTVYGSNPWRTKLLKSSWGETTVTSLNQPIVSSFSWDISSNYTTAGNQVRLDVTNMVQRMVYGQIPNYGWSIQVNNEAISSRTGAGFYSDESSQYPPQLEIKYYIPLSISDATIKHESATGSSDGSISFTTTNGSSTNYLYNWYDGDGNSLPGGTVLNGLDAGWYGVKLTGDDGIDETYYYAFLVGTECKEVTINFDPDQNYVDNAYSHNLVYNGINWGEHNWGNGSKFRTSREKLGKSVYSSHSLMRFRLWVPQEMEIEQANLWLKGVYHTGSNASSLDKIREDWNELLVSWNTAPTTNSAINAAMPMSIFSNDATVDMVDLWDEWKSNNTSNHGVLFELNTFGNPTKEQSYYSPITSVASNRPKIEFKVSLRYENDPFKCSPMHAVLKRDLTGVIYESVADRFYFSYENEYASNSAHLDYIIYRYADVLDPNMDGVNNLVSLDFGENQRILDVSSLSSGEVYVMQVTNDKGEKRFLRFKKE